MFDACSPPKQPPPTGPRGVWMPYNGPDQHPYQVVGLALSGTQLLAGRFDGIHITSVTPKVAGR